ncbi:MAG: hypothetical protein BJ554DRAFT_6125 [Olpidium bornovanus]|uniref:Uncharacterized protein n=1 Tax=Olpidium bornovanus TaxID=278681 RepID=A0A8H8DKF9_9FUNG|nr:MAG: hypothetical protein BJ554DRAFT_6125 [Olpidium bornovanus]
MDLFSDEYKLLGEEDVAVGQGAHTVLQVGGRQRDVELSASLEPCGPFNPAATWNFRKNWATSQEYQSFTDLRHSKDRSISAVRWHPNIKGIVAISCTQRMTLDERIELGSNVNTKSSLILVWSFHDPIHPQVRKPLAERQNRVPSRKP